jgi:3'-5' exonuclease
MIGLPPIRSGAEYYGTDYMGSNIIVWDLETVPDLAGFAAANDLVGKSDVEIREAIGDKFPKHIYHSIICIGALIAHREVSHWAVDALGAPHVGARSERVLIASFVDRIAELSPQLVTFNGSSFDLPVLRYRAMVYGVAAPGLSSRPYFNYAAQKLRSTTTTGASERLPITVRAMS